MVALARSAANGPKFSKLYDSGDVTGHSDDASAADLALAALFVFYTQDQAQIERLMRGSALMRPKWDQHRSYLHRTIAAALGRCSETYSPCARVPGGTRGRERRPAPAAAIRRLPELVRPRTVILPPPVRPGSVRR